jgi:hypothetical protein
MTTHHLAHRALYALTWPCAAVVSAHSGPARNETTPVPLWSCAGILRPVCVAAEVLNNVTNYLTENLDFLC